MFELIKAAVFTFPSLYAQHHDTLNLAEKPRIVVAQRCRAENFYHTNVQRAHEEIDFLPRYDPLVEQRKGESFMISTEFALR